LRGIEGFAFWRCQNEASVALGLHPGMPEKTVVIRTIAALGIADVRYGNEPMRGQFLNEPDHMAARAMKFFGENFKRWPSIAFTACEIGQIGVQFLGL